MAQRFNPASGSGYNLTGAIDATITITQEELGKTGFFRAGEVMPQFNTTVFNSDGSITYALADCPNWVTR